jgi:hypothetical protein
MPRYHVNVYLIFFLNPEYRNLQIMKVLSFLSFLLCFFLTNNISAQLNLAEIKFPASKIENLQSFTHSDKIFIFYDEINSQNILKIKKYYLVDANGSAQGFTANTLGSAVLCEVGDYDEDYYFYFVIGKRKGITLRALTHNKSSNKSSIASEVVEINGELLGVWNSDGLNLVLYNKSLNQIKILHINKLQIQNEKTFDLPFDLKYDYKYLKYIPESPLTSIEQGSSHYKLYQNNKQLIISIDHKGNLGSSLTPQTIVMILNIETGTQSIHWIKANTQNNFATFIHNDFLYRLTTSKKDHKFQVLRIGDKAIVNEKIFIRDSTLKDSSSYLRFGKSARINRKENLSKMMKIANASEPAVLILPGKDSCEFTMLWGTYLNDKSAGTFAGGNPLASIISFAITTAIESLAEPSGVSRYFYMRYDCNQSFSFGNGNKSLRQVIDNYEIDLEKKKIFFSSKGYREYNKGILGLYFDSRTSSLTLVKFDTN